MNINGRFMSEPETQAYINSLLTRIAELEQRHYNECAQIAHYDDELAKAKELTRAISEDMRELTEVLAAIGGGVNG